MLNVVSSLSAYFLEFHAATDEFTDRILDTLPQDLWTNVANRVALAAATFGIANKIYPKQKLVWDKNQPLSVNVPMQTVAVVRTVWGFMVGYVGVLCALKTLLPCHDYVPYNRP